METKEKCHSCENGFIEVCAECESKNIKEHFAGDEGWTICEDCNAIEQGYKEVKCKECSK